MSTCDQIRPSLGATHRGIREWQHDARVAVGRSEVDGAGDLTHLSLPLRLLDGRDRAPKHEDAEATDGRRYREDEQVLEEL